MHTSRTTDLFSTQRYCLLMLVVSGGSIALPSASNCNNTDGRLPAPASTFLENFPDFPLCVADILLLSSGRGSTHTAVSFGKVSSGLFPRHFRFSADGMDMPLLRKFDVFLAWTRLRALPLVPSSPSLWISTALEEGFGSARAGGWMVPFLVFFAKIGLSSMASLLNDCRGKKKKGQRMCANENDTHRYLLTFKDTHGQIRG